ncbi:hypothetical protein Y032_0031g2302 [Ancylostoma ceylanicum]|uniref:Uncharacterized protein n=1 Tax=Ancylostoma ceylanicum TaxID=53326 RepID=A0A016UPR5_9BILA|nr:hypothetical protein Y032_0031g2302 [Ancylostoma ceylanicum]
MQLRNFWAPVPTTKETSATVENPGRHCSIWRREWRRMSDDTVHDKSPQILFCAPLPLRSYANQGSLL